MSYADDAKRCLRIESLAIEKMADQVDCRFDEAIEMILRCTGRVIVTGIGKSGLVGRKISATLASTGTPSFFLHPTEGMHGDVGMVTKDDVVIAVSNSGETAEVVILIPILRRIGAKLIALCGSSTGTIVQNADIFIDVHVEQEACPLGLAPTASTTAAMAMGDALAMALLSARNFKVEDFAQYHPAGSLGRRLMRVSDIMRTGDANPVIVLGKTVREALFVITAKGLGVVSVTSRQGILAGIITDGDIRRGFEKGNEFLDLPVEYFMTQKPKTIKANELAVAALNQMEKNLPSPVTVLPVVDDDYRPIGMVHITDVLRQGVI